MATDIMGKAMWDYQFSGEQGGEVRTYSSLDEEDSFPVAYLFRDYNALPQLEQEALGLCRGSVLDIGCGAGSHSLYLMEKGLEVTSLDSSPGAAAVCKARGLKDVVQADFWTFGGRKFDTLLLLMNGIGIVGKLERFPEFFRKIKELLHPSGQVLFDSSDIIYMFERDEKGEYDFPGTYYGEVIFEAEYKGVKSTPFPWLYIDFDTIKKMAGKEGFQAELVRKGKHFDYLARLRLFGY